MPMLSLSFDTAHPAVQEKDFEEKLALKLLDTMLGHHMACLPNPVPYTQDGGDTRMIGKNNNYWLAGTVDAGSYRVVARYNDDESLQRLEKAKSMLVTEYGSALISVQDTAVKAASRPASKPSL